MLKSILLSDWTVYIVLVLLIEYTACDSVYVHIHASYCSHLYESYCAFSFHSIIIQP